MAIASDRALFSPSVAFGRRRAASTASNAAVSASIAETSAALTACARSAMPPSSAGFVALLPDGEVRDHRRKRGCQAPTQRGDRAAARRRRIRRDSSRSRRPSSAASGAGVRTRYSMISSPRRRGPAGRVPATGPRSRRARAPAAPVELALRCRKIAAGVGQRIERDQADQLRTGDAQAPRSPLPPRRLEHDVQRRRAKVSRLIETCAWRYWSMYQPMAFTALRRPGTRCLARRVGHDLACASRLRRPASRMLKAISLASGARAY